MISWAATCSPSGLPLPLFMFSDCSGCCDFSGEDSSGFNSCSCRKDLSPWIRMRYYFYDLLGASQFLWATDFWVDFRLPKHTLPHSFFIRWLLISVPSMSAYVLDFSAGARLSSWALSGGVLMSDWKSLTSRNKNNLIRFILKEM